MFSSKEQLQKRTPENGIDRRKFLLQLTNEYLETTSLDAKCQVLANLANFAYDPINYGYMRDTGVLVAFLHVLHNESNNKLLQFACAGVCNLCIDPVNAAYIVKHDGLNDLIRLLKCNNNDILADVIVTLIYLHRWESKLELNTPEIIQVMQDLKTSTDARLINLANIYLQDVCGSS